MAGEVIRMVRESAYNELMRDHMEARATIVVLESQLAAEASAVEEMAKVRKAITDQGLELVEENGEYRLEFQAVSGISCNINMDAIRAIADIGLQQGEQQTKENQ